MTTKSLIANLKGSTGPTGPTGLPGVNAVANDTATAGYVTTGGSATKTALDAAYAVRRDFDVKAYGAVGDGITDDTTAIQSAITAMAAAHGRLVVPPGTYLSNGQTFTGLSNFAVDMQGTILRKASSAAVPLLDFDTCTDVVIGTLRTNGNIANNNGTVDESKHDVRIQGCTRFSATMIDSQNPSGDSVYIRNDSQDINIGTVRSISTGFTGRQAVSIIRGKRITIGTIDCLNTGYNGAPTSMPGGLDIEPNSATDVVDSVQVGQLIYTGAGSSGLSIFSNYGQIIYNVIIGKVIINKLAGTPTAGTDVIVAGATNVFLAGIIHNNATTTNVCMSINNSDTVTIQAFLKGGSKGINIGSTVVVNNLTLTGSVKTCANHLITIYNLTNALIDMTLKNPANGFAVISKNAGGTSSNVKFKGNWAKDVSGSYAVHGGALTTGVTGWILQDVDFTGWPNTTRLFSGTILQAVQKINCLNLTYGTAIPTSEYWGIGDIIYNTAPASAGFIGWVCTAAGSPGTWKTFGLIS